MRIILYSGNLKGRQTCLSFRMGFTRQVILQLGKLRRKPTHKISELHFIWYLQCTLTGIRETLKHASLYNLITLFHLALTSQVILQLGNLKTKPKYLF
jgi:hypothetical protein